MMRAFRVSSAALCAATALGAQGIMVAPHAVFMTHGARGGAVTLINPGTEPVEVSIEIFYGYTTTDSTGQLTLVRIDRPDSTQPSAAGWLRAFPRRLSVGPEERQIVRLLATPPPGLPDGEYWARLAFTAQAGQVPVTGVIDTARIKVGLTLQVRTIVGLHYRTGMVHTGVTASGLGAVLVGDSLVVRARLARQGNAAYLGTVRGTLVDAKGAAAGEFTIPITVFNVNDYRWSAAVGALAPGRYALHLAITTEREDLDDQPGVVLMSAPVRDSAEVVVP